MKKESAEEERLWKTSTVQLGGDTFSKRTPESRKSKRDKTVQYPIIVNYTGGRKHVGFLQGVKSVPVTHSRGVAESAHIVVTPTDMRIKIVYCCTARNTGVSPRCTDRETVRA